jgi:hypothetical protein
MPKASASPPVGRTDVVVLLASGAGALAAMAALSGLLWRGTSTDQRFTSVRGQLVELYGRGLYRNDSLFTGAGNRGTDLVTLVVVLPLLALSVRRYRAGKVGGALMSGGALVTLAYFFASRALGSMYSEMFLVHVAAFALSAFGAVLAVRAVDVAAISGRWHDWGPYAALSRLLVAAGSATAVVWLLPLLSALVSEEPPKLLDHYTTMVTEVLDLGVITPATFVAASLARRRDPRAAVLAVPLLVLLVVLLPTIVAQTVFQAEAGYEFTAGEVAGPIAGFLVLGGFALFLLRVTVRAVDADTPHTMRGIDERSRR